jgi:hypothetical protein
VAYWLKKSALPKVNYRLAYWKLAVVTDDPGSKPDQRYARRRDRQKITFGKLSKI